MPTIQGPTAVAQSGSPPMFQVDPGPNAFYAYEIATQPELFDQIQHGAERWPENFYASWQASGLIAAPTVRLPDEVWNRLKNTNRLYYRVWTSASRDQWHSAETTTSDTQAASAPFVQIVRLWLGGVLTEGQVPVAEIWTTVMEQDVLRTVASAGECRVVIGLHMFSPKRPIDPHTAEWVVVATAQPDQTDARIKVELIRLGVQPLTVKAAKLFQDAQSEVGRSEVVALLANREWNVSTDQVERIGDIWIVSQLRPPPVESGVTAVIHALTGRVLYQATTNWQGTGNVLTP